MGLFEKATKYATEKHSGDHRKGTITPYIVHPMEAAAIVAKGLLKEGVETAREKRRAVLVRFSEDRANPSS